MRLGEIQDIYLRASPVFEMGQGETREAALGFDHIGRLGLRCRDEAEPGLLGTSDAASCQGSSNRDQGPAPESGSSDEFRWNESRHHGLRVYSLG